MRGVTLLELLTTVAVLAILTGLGAPALHAMVLDAQRTAGVNAFVGAVQLARSEAVKRHSPVTLCKTIDYRQCAGPGTDWTTGWLVFVPGNPLQPTRLDDPERILLAHQNSFNGRIEANREAFVIRSGGVRSTNGTVIFCDDRVAAHARAVIISTTGRPRSSGYSAAGTPLPC
ncbi:MAG: GspH/FimT family pseudopilin [Gammaproteobacteria bacterium]|nr:GspH/FimT family pseudopilin [Gammaproteobacteria bacterium]